MFLEYKIHTEETPYWIVTYEIFLDKEYFRFGEKLNYRLSEASSDDTFVEKFSGWILDQSVNPPVKLPLSKASQLREKELDNVWENSFSNSILNTEIIPSMYDSTGESTEYTLQLYYEPTRFYPIGKPEYYIKYNFNPSDNFTLNNTYFKLKKCE